MGGAHETLVGQAFEGPFKGALALGRPRRVGAPVCLRGRQRLALAHLDDAHLERARACVDYENGHFQPEISSESSPAVRAYIAAVRRASTISWRSAAARSPSPGTRSMTSITRWKRSMSLRIAMSSGVVTVPSSL